MEPLFAILNLKIGFVAEGSDRVVRIRSFKGSVDFFIRSLFILNYLEAFSNLPNLFLEFGKKLLFFRVYNKSQEDEI